MRTGTTKIILIAGVSLGMFTARAQDVHFSQFYENPLLLNPAAAGASNHDIRFTVNYKNQWKSVINPFKTAATSIDTKLFKTGKEGSNFMGLGITMYTDKAGKANLSTTQGNLNIAYNVRPSNNSNFSAGINAGFFQKNMTPDGLKWDKQYDGNTYDPSRATGEADNFQRLLRFDLGLGLMWRFYDKFSQFKMDIGGAATHVNQPKISFYKKDPTLNMKYLGLLNLQIKMGDRPMFLLPSFMYVSQGPYSEIVGGANVRFILGEDTRENAILNTFSLISSNVQVGVFYRLRDALIFTTGVEVRKALYMGLSYDLNISKLQVASRLRGGLEFSLVYKGMFGAKSMSHRVTD